MHFFDSLGSPSRGAPPLGGEGWAQEHGHPLSHPSVTFGDSSPRRGATHTRYFGCRRGEHCSPARILRHRKTPRADMESAPTPTKIWPRRGQCGKRKKSVKKNAALLHFLGFFSLTHPFGVPRGERLTAHNERHQFAAQTRSCGYSPRWGEHCSLPGFAALNRGPLLATPQSPGPGSAASEQRDFFRFLFWSQKRKALREKPFKARGPPQGGGPRAAATAIQNQTMIVIPPQI